MDTFMEFGARVLLASPFLVSALDKTLRPDGARTEIRRLTEHLGLHAPASVAYLVVVVLQWSGGLLLLYPLTAPIGAIVLIIFLLPVTFLAHAYWTVSADARATKRDHFFANVALAGGLILVATGTVR